VKRIIFLPLILLTTACALSTLATPTAPPTVPHVERWGIYRLDLASQAVGLIFSSPEEIGFLQLNPAGDRFAFSRKSAGGVDSAMDTGEEVYTLGFDGSGLKKITDNNVMDIYPAWSPDGTRLAFLSWRSTSLGIFVMNADGSGQQILYDSEANEADIDWVADRIVFTRDSRIWIMRSDGSEPQPVSAPPRAGEWGHANLPFGDYDPRISPDGSRVVFERLTNDQSSFGNYDFFVIDLASGVETRLTNSGDSQGLASWSHSGQQILYIVSAIGSTGKYRLYRMDADGKNARDITPAYFPAEFLVRWAVFSQDDSAVYFIGEWWSSN
jgi:Tol biopolymer transport system component